MHQQVRCSIRKTLREGSRERVDDESLVEILRILRVKSLRSAGRMHTDGGDEFVFSVHHEPGDDKPDKDARDLLREKDYEARVYRVEDFLLDDTEGALLQCIEDFEKEPTRERVVEVYVGAADTDGKVPVQLVTRKMLRTPLP